MKILFKLIKVWLFASLWIFPLSVLGNEFQTIANRNEIDQQKVINGKVVDINAQPLPGVTVMIKGTELGTVTDIDGEFSLSNITGDATLVFSFIGMKTQEVIVGNQEYINVIMSEETLGLDEIIVTAFGIKRQARTLSYATQNIDSEEISEIKDPNNFLNALQGKVSNALITQTGSVGSEGRIILRGNSSIAGSNNALIVVDGIPIGTSTSRINPDNIESLTILRGASASALYGSEAGNGVIEITTKTGKSGKLSVNFISGITFDSPFALPRVQNIYGQGNNGVLDPSVGDSWGAKMSGQEYTNIQGNIRKYSPEPNNIRDYFRTGLNLTNTINISGGSDKIKTYLSYTNNKVDGIMPGNSMTRHLIDSRINYKISERLSTDAKITYNLRDIKNIPRASEGNNPIIDLYQIPRNYSIEDAKQYEVLDNLGIPKPAPWPSTLPSIYGNPYWATYNDVRNAKENNVSLFFSAKYQISDRLNITGKANIDKLFASFDESRHQGTLLWALRPGGYYSLEKNESTRKWFDLMLHGDNSIGENFNINYILGGIYQDNLSSSNSSIADGLTIPNKFNINFASSPTVSSSGSQIQIQSILGQFNMGFRNAIFLDGSLRNDCDSRLPAPHSYQYYSAGISAILSDLIKLPEKFSYLKTSFSYAEVGNGGRFGLLNAAYSYTPGAGNGYLSRSTVVPIPGLKPEIVRSREASVQGGLFKNRLGFSINIYRSNSFNQLLTITVPAATGFTGQYINAGNIQNKGIEIEINSTPIATKDFNWRMDFNIAFNRNKILELSENLKVIYLMGHTDFGGRPKIEVGGAYGDLVSDVWKQDNNGNYIVNSNGLPLTTKATGEVQKVVGNFNPLATTGLTNTLTYKGFSFRALVDGRIGGIIISGTEQNLAYSGITEGTLPYREGGWNLGGVDLEGNPVNKEIDAQRFWQTASGKRFGTGQFFTYDATNIRLRELSLGYNIDLQKESFFESIKVSLIGRNLFWIYRGKSKLEIPGVKKRKMWMDPEVSLGTGNNQGVEYGTLPSSRGYGLSFSLTY